MNFNTKKGFTLIELLVVVSIISLLTSVVLAALGDAKSKAVNTALVSEVRSLYQESEIYFVQSNRYATSTQGSDGETSCPTSEDSSWGFFGTSKGIELTQSIKLRAGSGDITCAINPDSWTIYLPVYTNIFAQATDSVVPTAYAQSALGSICFDNATPVIRANFLTSSDSDGDQREFTPNYSVSVNDQGRFVCKSDI